MLVIFYYKKKADRRPIKQKELQRRTASIGKKKPRKKELTFAQSDWLMFGENNYSNSCG
jgi:hypothetical protein